MTASEHFAAWACTVMADGLPAPVREAVADHVADTVGVVIAGSAGEPVTSVGRYLGPLGQGETPSAADQALVLGTAAHADDFDNSHFPSLVHPSGVLVLVPAALAAGAAAGRNGEELLRAIAVGEELALRLGVAACAEDLGNSVLFERGFHPTSVCCTAGAAATAGALLGSPPEALAHGIGIAASFASGLLEGNRTGGTVKPVHSGWAAASGIRAALLARAGVTAPPTVFEGRFGFGHAFTGREMSDEALFADLGQRWETTRVGVKAFPANGFTHTAIETALDLREQGVRCEDVAEATLGVAAPTVRTIGEPAAEKSAPKSGYAARFSGPFTFALALYGGGGLGLGLADFDDGMLGNQAVRALAGRTRVVADEERTARFPRQTGCTTTVQLRDGTTRTSAVDVPRGSISRPLTAGQLIAKFRDCAARRLESAQVARLEDRLAPLIAGAEVAPFTRQLVQLVLWPAEE